jgi:hypothetical protein
LNLLWQRNSEIQHVLDPEKCPSHLLSMLLHHLGNPFSFPFQSDRVKCKVAEGLDLLYTRIGTPRGIIDFIKTALGYAVTLHPFHEEASWTLGDAFYGRLGITTSLYTSREFIRNSYEVRSGVILTDDETRIVRDIAEWADSARMHLLRIVGPGSVYLPYWTLGTSSLGIDSMLGV